MLSQEGYIHRKQNEPRTTHLLDILIKMVIVLQYCFTNNNWKEDHATNKAELVHCLLVAVPRNTTTDRMAD